MPLATSLIVLIDGVDEDMNTHTLNWKPNLVLLQLGETDERDPHDSVALCGEGVGHHRPSHSAGS